MALISEDDPVFIAFYDEMVRGLKREIERNDFDADDLPGLFQRARLESQTAQVLVVTSYLEDRFTSLMQSNLFHLSAKESRDRLFGGNGPLSTFGGRVSISYHLGWLSKETFKSLGAMRRIRNEFAHNAYKTSYEDPLVGKHLLPLIDGLSQFCGIMVPLAMKHPENHSLRKLDDLSTEERALSAFAVVIGRTLQEMLILPAAVRNRIPPGDLLTAGQLENWPQNVRACITNTIKSVFVCFEPISSP